MKIKQIVVDIGGEAHIFDSSNGEIEHISKNGEMALVDWYKQNNKEFNGKYVIATTYHE